MNTENYFQRQDDLWDKTKQSRLIESILIRFPMPAFFFDASDDSNWLVVDGLQRLSSIRNFAVEKTQPLSNMEFLTDLNGKYWDDLTDDLQRRIEEAQVVIYKIMPGTPTDVKFNIFKRINTGGLILEPQEIRHALFQGTPAKFVAKLASTEAFVEATGGKIKTNRMLDRDFANRFLSFYLLGVENFGKKEYGQDLDTYMSTAMANLNNKSSTELEEIKVIFIKCLETCYEIFGEETFRKISRPYKRLPPINKSLYDALTVQIAKLSDEERNQLIGSKSEFRRLLKRTLRENTDFFVSVSTATGDRNKVYYRHSVVNKLIQTVIL
jgi:uncharacterized protein with ParB-like and HNH nuclease domain